MGYFSIAAHQTGVLLKKNFRLARHNWKGAIAFVLIPPAIMLLLWVLAQTASPSTQLAQSIPNPPSAPIMPIPRCQPTVGTSSCYTLLYNYAGHPGVEALMASVQAQNPHIPSSEVLALAGNADTVNAWLFDHYNTTQGAYVFVFNNVTFATELPEGGPLYVLQTNSSTYTSCAGSLTAYECASVGRDIEVPMLQAMTNALMQYHANRAANGTAVPDLSAIGLSTVTTPFAHPVIFVVSILPSAAAVWWMFAALFPLVLMLMQVVGEKEAKLKYAMSLIGVKWSAYWISWAVLYFIQLVLANLATLAMMAALGYDIVRQNSFGLIIVLTTLFSISLISVTFFMSTLFNDVKNARLCALLYLFLFGLFSGIGSIIYADGSSVPEYWCNVLALLPPMIFSKSLLDLQTATSGQTVQVGISWAERASYTQRFPFTTVFNWLIFDTVLYTVLALYLDGALPDVMGVRRAPWYPFTARYWGLAAAPAPSAALAMHGEISHPADEDADVRAEYDRVRENRFHEAPALVVRGLRKVFTPLFSSKGFVAVDNVSFAIPRNSMLCLLGPNGAGKSTTISMITGAVEPTSGDAVLHGLSTSGSMDAIRESLGVCPQFDVLWDDLTGDENLQVFAGLKGLGGLALNAEVQARLEEVDLIADRAVQSVSYSGGMRRRLSVAMALTCSPSVVLLDEPTTGMDPVSRRKVWDIIERAKSREDRALILTTHSMEEAEVLSDKIAIICNGRIRCIGTSLRLKEKYGSGYRVQVVAGPDVIGAVWAAFVAQFPQLPVVETTMLQFTVQIAPDQVPLLPAVFTYLRARTDVRDFHVSLTTLEDVFLRVANDAKGEEFQADEADAAVAAATAAAAAATAAAHPGADGASSDAGVGSVNRPGAARVPVASPKPSTNGLQIKALFAKTWHLQKRRRGTNCCQIACPSFIVVIMLLLQVFVLSSLNKKIPTTLTPTVFPMNDTFLLQGVSDDAPAFTFALVNSSVGFAAGLVELAQLPAYNPIVGAPYGELVFPSVAALQSFAFAGWNQGIPSLSGGIDVSSITDTNATLNLLYNITHSSTFEYLPGLFDIAAETQLERLYGVRYELAVSDMPVKAHENKFNIISFLAAILFPLVLFFQFPLFVGGVMYDKEKKLIEIMKMMGMRMSVYWLVNFVFDMLLYLLAVFVLVVVGVAVRFDIFTINSAGTYLILFLLWGVAMTSMAFLFTTFFGKEFIATVVSYLLVIVSFITGNVLFGQVAGSPAKLFLYSLYPYFAFQRGVWALAIASSGSGLTLGSPGDLAACYGFLIVQTVVMLFLSWYLEQIFPAGYGVKKSPLFCLTPSYWRGECAGPKHVDHDEESSLLGSSVPFGAEPVADEDEDVAAARRDVFGPQSVANDGVRVLGLRKEYGAKVAVSNLAFGIRRGEVFGLLGHNGAGKTTAISVLSGLTEPSKGDARIESLSIRTEMDALHRVMGVCPQHDLLWATMTAEEHLYFYGRLKGLEGAALRRSVEDVLSKLHLSYVRTRLAGRFSGGMKRRLSIGLALIGSPRIIFLDEPTTGLDPKNRRSIWTIIANACRDSSATVILTTHSMEEAEALSNRIGIMAAGQLKVIGTSNHLKTKFAAGFKLTLQLDPEHIDLPAVIAFVHTLVPSAVHLPQSLAASHHFHLPADEVDLALIFSRMDAEKARLHIAEWTVLQKTLEDVLLRITEAAHSGSGDVAVAAAEESRASAAAERAALVRRSVGGSNPPARAASSHAPQHTAAASAAGVGSLSDDVFDEDTARD